MNNIINLPVSIGEALDKLSILNIKLDKINDPKKRENVKKEYDILYTELESFLNKFNFYYVILKKINLDIWEMQDDFRYNKGDKVKLCFKIIEDNDRRFRIKKKINDIANSTLKEEKGYKPSKAFVLTHLGLGDNITAVGLVRYLSTFYDEILVVCKQHNKNNCELFYQDDDSIKIYAIPNDEFISPKHGFDINKFNEITNDYEVYMIGCHNLQNKKCNYNNLPFCFYEQINLDPQIFWDYFYIPIPEQSYLLYEKIKDFKYAFIHNTSSTGLVFSIETVEKNLNIDRNNVLFINPNINCYQSDHKFYDIANYFIGHKLSMYIETIKNANYNVLSDSSFFCIAINLDLKNDCNYFKSRDNRNYLLYCDNYKFKNVNRKVFKLL